MHYECKRCGGYAAHCGCHDPFMIEERTAAIKKRPHVEFIPKKGREAAKLLKSLGYVVYKRV